MQQNTDSWEKWRQEGIGSSDAPVIMGVSPWKTPLQLWEEKIGIRQGFQGNNATIRGHQMEPKARAAFELEMGIEFIPMVAEHFNFPYMRASLDGWNAEEQAVLEIKCPGKEDHDLAKSGKVPEKYWPQLQHQLFVTGGKVAYYYSYDGESGITIPVYPDHEYMKQLFEKEQDFWEMVVNKKQPEPSSKDAVILEENEALAVAELYAKTDAAIKELEKELEGYKKKIVSMCDHQITKIGKLTVTKSIRSGSVDYASIPELDGIDVEKYRKKPTQVVTIRVGK
jgi:putative phage-type endonuclease